MEEHNIVAIDLGTSKIALTVATRDGKTATVIYYSETPSDGIERGSIHNVRKASEAIRKAIQKAEETLQQEITSAVVNMPKYPITRKSAVSSMERNGEDCVEESEIRTLMQNAVSDCPLDKPEVEKIYQAVPQSFSDEDTFQMKEDEIIGRTSDRIEGRYDLYIGKKKSLAMIDQAFLQCGYGCGLKLFPALSVSKVALTEDEKDNGVALVDMGAGATSVTIWKDGVMRWYDSIPFGGKLVTKDIQEVCRIGESLAENIKKAYGVCIPERIGNLSDKIIQIKGDGHNAGYELQVKFLSKIVTARMTEITDAVLYMIQESGYADRLGAGIVLCGGVSRCGNCASLFRDRSGFNVRVAGPRRVFTSEGIVNGIESPAACNALGMMLLARDCNYMNCTLPISEQKKEEPEEKQPTTKAGDKAGDTQDYAGTVFSQMPPVEKTEKEKKTTGLKESRSRKAEEKNKKKKGGVNFIRNLFEAITEEEEV